ncbi:MAG: M48 family metallopeptidase [Deltaproteobacteria bacterium]|nr:M48 family metallopeptidase [Deltaproteobacteria bacterium]MBN2671475.1 M48 family metallopeptidase [Deltaproteobacteria bacterium]
MTCNMYTWIFLSAFAIHQVLETTLAILQLKHLKTRGKKVPKHLRGKVSLETIQQAVAYNTEKMRFGLLMRFVDMVPLWVFILFGFEWLDSLVQSWFQGELWRGLAFISIVSGAGALLGLPSSLYFTFVIEQKHGFNKQTIRGFFADKLKESFISLILGGGLLALVLWIMSATTYWWFIAYGVILVFQLLMMWIYPLVIMPLFNKFVPVSEELSDAVSGLAQNLGFPLKGVVAMDGSRRSAHSNAFIIGFKSARRIVLYDTLIEKLSIPSLVAVLAHELGHFKLGHIKKRLATMAVLGLGVFGALYWMSQQPAMYHGLGFSTPSAYAALIVFGLLFGEVSFPFGFISRLFSRRDEYAADRFAVDAVKNSHDLKDALITLTKQNLSSPGSHRWYRGYYNSHPSLRERLKAVDTHAETKNYPTEKG